MSRRFKAVLVNEDRTANVYYINKKLRIGSILFKPYKKAHELYLIDSKYSMTTTTKRLGVPFRYTTFYYKRNVPKPVDMPQLHGGQAIGEIIETKTQDKKAITTYEAIITKPIHMPAFEDFDYTSISSEEMDKLLDPNFISMVAKANKKQNEQLQFYLAIGTACGIAFLIYYVMQTLPGNVAGKVLEFLGKTVTGG